MRFQWKRSVRHAAGDIAGRRWMIGAAALTLGAFVALSPSVLVFPGARAAESPPNHGVETARTGQIQIKYEQPTDPAFLPYYKELSRRQVLERVQGFMAPLRLPRPLTVRTAECGGSDTIPYKSGGPVTICYELVRHIAAVARMHTSDMRERAQILYGTFIEAVLHQLAYAVFDQLKVPIWGREDDAADHLAAFIMVSFGDKVALTTILGTAKFFQYSNHTWTGADFASAASPEAQRFYNYLCVAYGADPITFHFLGPRPGPTNLPHLTEHRARRCARISVVSTYISEYLQVRHAFNLRIMPYVDPNALIRVRASQWLLPSEMPETTP